MYVILKLLGEEDKSQNQVNDDMVTRSILQGNCFDRI